jgi:hypothetical protein
VGSDGVSAMAIHPEVQDLEVGVGGADGFSRKSSDLTSPGRDLTFAISNSLLQLTFHPDRNHVIVDGDKLSITHSKNGS